MPAPRHEAWTLVLALGLHAGALFALRLTIGDRATRLPAPSERQGSELSFDVELSEPSASAPSAAPISDDIVTRGASSRGANARWALPPIAEPGDSEPEPDAAEQNGEREADSPARGPIDLGIGADGWQRWVTAPPQGERAPAERNGARKNRFQVFRAPPVSTTGGLQEGLEERDRALGLGPSGRVLSVAHRAAHETVAPAVGVARFDVTVLRTGAVEVTLGGASGEVEAWRKVAQHIANELRAAPPRIAPPRKGVRMVVELVAEETLPNGTKLRSLTSPHLEVTPPKLESTERAREALSTENPTTTDPAPATLPPVKLDLPGVYLAEHGKVCSYRLGLSALGPIFQGGCDPSHIGAKPQRMVHARVVEQALF